MNRDYEEKFALDNDEVERRQEAERVKEEREKEYKRIQEEERSKRIQERIFGKKSVSFFNNVKGMASLPSCLFKLRLNLSKGG